MRYEILETSGSSVDSFECPDMAVEVYIRGCADGTLVFEEAAILEIDEDGNAVWVEVDRELVEALT